MYDDSAGTMIARISNLCDFINIHQEAVVRDVNDDDGVCEVDYTTSLFIKDQMETYLY